MNSETGRSGIGILVRLEWTVSAEHPRMKKKNGRGITPKLTEPELDLLGHMEQGYQLETDSLGADPVLRNLKDGEVIRPVSVNRNTIKILEERELIKRGKGKEPLTVIWHLGKTK